MILDSAMVSNQPTAARPHAHRVRALALIVLAALLGIAGRHPLAAQQGDGETGTVIANGMVVWVRATGRGAVQLFMSPGYRDAFARPHELPAGAAAAWADSVNTLARSKMTGDVRSPAWSEDSLVLERRVGADSAGLVVMRTGVPVARFADAAAVQIIDAIAAAARLTQHASADAAPRTVAARSAAPAVAVPARAARVDVVTATSATVTVATTTAPPAGPPPAVSESRVTAKPEPAPSAPDPPAEPATPAVDSAAALGISVSLTSHVDRGDLPVVVDTTIAPARHASSVVAQAAPLPTPVLADRHVDTPLGPFVVPGAEMVSRDRQIRYCYTQLGLRYDRHLRGDLTVRVTVSSAGTADTVEVTKRTWDGVAAAEVESCMRALIEDWSFGDDAAAAAQHTVELHFTLTPDAQTIAARGAEPVSAPPR